MRLGNSPHYHWIWTKEYSQQLVVYYLQCLVNSLTSCLYMALQLIIDNGDNINADGSATCGPLLHIGS